MMPWGSVSNRFLMGLVVADIVAIWLGNLVGWWWMASLIGFSFGMMAPVWRGIVSAIVTGAAGWALGLLWDAIHDPIGPVAAALTTTLGMGDSPLVSILLTILLGGLLAGSTAWLGRALRLVNRPTSDSPSK